MTPEQVWRYTVGFYFSVDHSRVALIIKDHPEWQAGKINGIGGKIKEGEEPHKTQVREFFEETGVVVPFWEPVCVLTGRGNPTNARGEGDPWEVHFFRAFGDVDAVRTMEGETVTAVYLNRVLDPAHPQLMPSLRWLIPMALALDDDHADTFTIAEQYLEEFEEHDQGTPVDDRRQEDRD